MASRKPPGTDWESWIDQVIQDGRERGEFDNLPGTGKPLPDLDNPHDDMWWVRKKLQSEGVSYLPPTLALRKDREDTVARLDAETSETRVRQLLEELNSRIQAVNSRSVAGPPSTVMPLDIDLAVQAWQHRRAHALRTETRLPLVPLVDSAGDGGGQRETDTSSTPRTRQARSRGHWLRWPRRGGAPSG